MKSILLKLGITLFIMLVIGLIFCGFVALSAEVRGYIITGLFLVVAFVGLYSVVSSVVDNDKLS